MDIEYKLREILIPVLGVSSIDDIKHDSALVKDLGAESIDFVEILYLIETTFGVKINIRDLLNYSEEDIRADGKIAKWLAEKLNNDFNTTQFKEGQTIRDIFESLTVHNIATIIEKKIKESENS